MLLASAFARSSTGDRPDEFNNSSAADLKTGITLHKNVNKSATKDVTVEVLNNFTKICYYLSATFVIASAASAPAASAMSAG